MGSDRWLHELKRVLFVIEGAIGLLMSPRVGRASPSWTSIAASLGWRQLRQSPGNGRSRVGRLGMGFFPRFHVTMEDGRILGETRSDSRLAKKTNLWIELLPLLRRGDPADQDRADAAHALDRTRPWGQVQCRETESSRLCLAL